MLGRSLQSWWILLLVSLILSEIKTFKETQESVCRFIYVFLRWLQGKKKCFINNGNRYKFDDNMMKISLDYTASSTCSVDILPFKRDINVKKNPKHMVYFFLWKEWPTKIRFEHPQKHLWSIYRSLWQTHRVCVPSSILNLEPQLLSPHLVYLYKYPQCFSEVWCVRDCMRESINKHSCAL